MERQSWIGIQPNKKGWTVPEGQDRKGTEKRHAVGLLAVQDGQQAFVGNADFGDFYAVNSSMGMWPYDDDLFQSYAEDGIREMKANMEKLYRLCRDHHIKMSVSVHPWPDQIARNDLNCIYVKIWEKWCRERQIDFYNLFPYFIDDRLDPRHTLDQYFIRGDIHWNKAGHNLAANAIMQIRADK